MTQIHTTGPEDSQNHEGENLSAADIQAEIDAAQDFLGPAMANDDVAAAIKEFHGTQ